MHQTLSRILLVVVVISGFCFTSSSSAQAGDWAFRRSYYSHHDSPGYTGGEVPEQRSAYRPAYLANHPRFAIRSGYRYNSMVLQNGLGTDRTTTYESWFDADN